MGQEGWNLRHEGIQEIRRKSVWKTTLENKKTQELEKWIYTHLNSYRIMIVIFLYGKVPLFQKAKGINHCRGEALCKIIMFILIFNPILKNIWIDQ